MSENNPELSPHNFHDEHYVKNWVEQAMHRTPARRDMFYRLSQEIGVRDGPQTILEYGCGPGFLASWILQHCDVVRYDLLDFSKPMLALSAKRLAGFNQARYFRRNFRYPAWIEGMPNDYTVVVSMQATHELRDKQRVTNLYQQVKCLLRAGGTFYMCDHIPDAGGTDASLFMTTSEHLEALAGAGFTNIRALRERGGLGLLGGDVAHD